MREWRNGRRAGFRHQFRKSEGSTPFSRTTKIGDDSLKISADFILITHFVTHLPLCKPPLLL